MLDHLTNDLVEGADHEPDPGRQNHDNEPCRQLLRSAPSFTSSNSFVVGTASRFHFELCLFGRKAVPPPEESAFYKRHLYWAAPQDKKLSLMMNLVGQAIVFCCRPRAGALLGSFFEDEIPFSLSPQLAFTIVGKSEGIHFVWWRRKLILITVGCLPIAVGTFVRRECQEANSKVLCFVLRRLEDTWAERGIEIVTEEIFQL